MCFVLLVLIEIEGQRNLFCTRNSAVPFGSHCFVDENVKPFVYLFSNWVVKNNLYFSSFPAAQGTL